MKICFAIVLLMITSSLTAQSLKDSLFSGKLKNPHKQAELAKDSAKKAAQDSIALATGIKKDSPVAATADPNAPVSSPITTDENKPATETGKLDETMPDSLNRTFQAKQKAWKRYIDQQTIIISAQADDTRKVRTGEYYVEFDYEIGLNGRVKTSNVTVSPENEFILAAVKDALTRTPVLAPPVYGDGKPRPLAAKQQMTILKKK